MRLSYALFFSLFGIFWLSVGWPRPAAAQAPGPIRTTYHDAARTQRRAVYGTLLRGADTLAHGPFRRYYSGGSLAETGHFTNGLADSTWTRYYPTGQLARRLPMQAGRPDGPFVVWHPNGQLAQRGTYRQGQLLDSLVTRTATGQPRLLARLAADSTGLTGRFVQWRSSITAQ